MLYGLLGSSSISVDAAGGKAVFWTVPLASSASPGVAAGAAAKCRRDARARAASFVGCGPRAADGVARASLGPGNGFDPAEAGTPRTPTTVGAIGAAEGVSGSRRR